MNELEQYIRAHAAEFDSAEPPRGHEERFLKRLETAGKSRRNGPSWQIFMATLAVAASLTAVWLVVRNRPFLGTGSSPEAIYQLIWTRWPVYTIPVRWKTPPTGTAPSPRSPRKTFPSSSSCRKKCRGGKKPGFSNSIMAACYRAPKSLQTYKNN